MAACELPPFSAQLPEIAKRDYGDQPWRAALEHLIEQLLAIGPAGNMQQTTGHFTAQEIAEPALDPQLSR